jgi:hypothetical protein
MVGEARAIQPLAPETLGLGQGRTGLLEVGRQRAGTPTEGDEAGLAGLQPVPSAGGPAVVSQPQVPDHAQPDLARGGGRRLVVAGSRVLPHGVAAPVVEGGFALQGGLDAAMHAGRDPDQQVVGVEVAGRAAVGF